MAYPNQNPVMQSNNVSILRNTYWYEMSCGCYKYRNDT